VCDTDADHPICVQTIFPDGTADQTFLGLGSCSGYFTLTTCNGLLVRFLSGLGGLYTQSDPWTMVVQCDRTACAGKGVTSYSMFIDGDDDGTFITSPACVSNDHDIIDPSLTVTDPISGQPKPAQFCTDYVASHRDNAQDLILVVHLTSAADGGGAIRK
jgi:hypothetical protein